ncbi:MAG: AmmeMemoRadiSam system radical SAM enzyme [bacterium]|nr:AmmeMemoRadiSam system radical SAM enzyme [bacterium]
MRQAQYFEPLEHQKLRCQLCPRACVIKPGQVGFCQNRENRGGQLYLNSYGLSSGFQLDPIEKKPLNHFYPGSAVLSLGTIGCNLSCKFCQNWGISKEKHWDHLARPVTPEQLAQAAIEAGARSVALTYNDPVIYAEFAIDLAAACRAAGVEVVLVTAGYVNEEPREALFKDVSAANVDLKAFDDHFYHRLCGGRLSPVKETLVYLAQETKVWLEVTTLLIEGENDDPAELEAMAQWMVEALGPQVPWHISAFHPDHQMLGHPRTGLESLDRARQIGLEAGLHYVYTGNVYHPEGDATHCPRCSGLVIQRDRYQILSYQLGPGGYCRHCGAQVHGHFADQPGGASPVPRRVDI